jgi:superfamily II DNA helicase RecQ
MQMIRLASTKGMIEEIQIKNAFKNLYKPLIVLANPKTVINMKYAKKDVKDQIIRTDQLINYLKRFDSPANDRPSMTDEGMNINANRFLAHHDATPKDYTSKYKITPKAIPIEETEIHKALKEYRLLKSRELNIKPYFIYNNAQMEEIIKMMPLVPEDLLKVSGFDGKRVKDFGEAILNIISKYRF